MSQNFLSLTLSNSLFSDVACLQPHTASYLDNISIYVVNDP